MDQPQARLIYQGMCIEAREPCKLVSYALNLRLLGISASKNENMGNGSALRRIDVCLDGSHFLFLAVESVGFAQFCVVGGKSGCKSGLSWEYTGGNCWCLFFFNVGTSLIFLPFFFISSLQVVQGAFYLQENLC